MQGQQFNIDSAAFNCQVYLKEFVRDRTLVQVIEKNNELFTESKALDNDQQTLVYENYSKFMAASDTLSELHKQMSALDSDLADLKSSVSKINSNYGALEDSMGMKWKQIRKLDTMEKDLNKLKYLSELPQMFKRALAEYQAQPETQKDATVFEEPTRYYGDYCDILTDYKQTKFMVSLYGEIKSYIQRIKTYLNKQLEQLTSNSSLSLGAKQRTEVSSEVKILVRFLLVFSDEKSHLKSQFLKVKAKQIQDAIQKQNTGTEEDAETKELAALEDQASADFLKEAIQDYKELFLSPIRTSSDAHVKAPVPRSSNIRNKDVIVLKSEQEEKQETKDLAKFATQLTASYFSKIEKLLLNIDSSSDLREALSQFDKSACSLEELCNFQYRIEKGGGEHSRQSILMRQTNSKSFLLGHDIRESPKAVDFKHMAYCIAEKALTFYVRHEMQKLKAQVLEHLLVAYEADCQSIDAAKTYATIFECVSKNILDASPKSSQGPVESIFEEEQDLIALLLQRSLKKFFTELKQIILALVDPVNDTSSKQLAQMLTTAIEPQQQQQNISDTQSVATQQQLPEEEQRLLQLSQEL